MLLRVPVEWLPVLIHAVQGFHYGVGVGVRVTGERRNQDQSDSQSFIRILLTHYTYPALLVPMEPVMTDVA